jgi:hypothetical protein
VNIGAETFLFRKSAVLLTSPSGLLTSLVGHLQTAKDTSHQFASGLFISWAHDRRELEAEHRFMEEAVHTDFATGTTRSTVIFGTTSAHLEAIRAFRELAKREAAVSYLSQSCSTYD